MSKDERGNATVGDHLKLYGCSNNMVHMHDGRLAVLQGLDDLIIVSTTEALLICRKHDEQMIKQFVSDVAAGDGEKYV